MGETPEYFTFTITFGSQSMQKTAALCHLKMRREPNFSTTNTSNHLGYPQAWVDGETDGTVIGLNHWSIPQPRELSAPIDWATRALGRENTTNVTRRSWAERVFAADRRGEKIVFSLANKFLACHMWCYRYVRQRSVSGAGSQCCSWRLAHNFYSILCWIALCKRRRRQSFPGYNLA